VPGNAGVPQRTDGRVVIARALRFRKIARDLRVAWVRILPPAPKGPETLTARAERSLSTIATVFSTEVPANECSGSNLVKDAW